MEKEPREHEVFPGWARKLDENAGVHGSNQAMRPKRLDKTRQRQCMLTEEAPL